MDVARLVLFMNCAILVYCQSCTSDPPTESEWQSEYFEEMRSEIKSIRQLFRAQQKDTICSHKQMLQKMKSELRCIRQNLSNQKWALEAFREKCHETVIVQNGRTSKIRPTPSPTSTSAKDRCPRMADIAFLVDSSSSLSEIDFLQTKIFMTGVILDLPVDGGDKVRVSVTSYASSPKTYFTLDRYATPDDIFYDIAAMMQQRGGRNLNAAVRSLQTQVFTADKGDRPGALNVVIIVTRTRLDGNTRTVAQALSLLNDTHVMIVGVGDDDGRALWDLVTPPRSSNLFLARSFEDTMKLEKQILAQICEVCDSNIPSLKTTTRPLTTTVRTTTTATTVRPTTQRTTTTTRRETSSGFLPTTSIGPRTSTTLKYGEARNKRLDLVFAFDTSSGGLSRQQFLRTQDFTKRLVNMLNVGADDTRIGAISFSNNIRTAYHLKETTTVDDVKNKLGKVQYRPGKRNLKQGMNAIRDTMFLEQNGNRASVPNVAIIFTDGFSGEEAATYDEESLSIAERGIELFQIVWQQKGRDVVHTGERIFAVNSVETLNGILEDVKQAVCDVG